MATFKYFIIILVLKLKAGRTETIKWENMCKTKADKQSTCYKWKDLGCEKVLDCIGKFVVGCEVKHEVATRQSLSVY